MSERRGVHPIKRLAMGLLAPFVENWHGLSLTRFLAVACFAFVAHTVWEEQRLSWVDFSVLLLGVSTAFGKKVFLTYLSRTSTKVEGKDSREVVDVTVRQIQERREQASKDGWDGRESA